MQHPYIFALALLLAGISSSITAGMAGGLFFSGIFNHSYDIHHKDTKRGVLITDGTSSTDHFADQISI